MEAKYIGQCATKALIEEVNTSPKPGLVDRITNGAHKDMNLQTFYKSAEALEPYFTRMAAEGFQQYDNPEECFMTIRKIGLEAEDAMYLATGGVNTHKGLIFSLGILCACVGSCIVKKRQLTMSNIIEIEQKMVRRTLVEELADIGMERVSYGEKSHGEYLYKQLGTRGVRGEAINGFVTVRKIGFPVMLEGLKKKKNFNLVKLQTLMTYMSITEDTNVLSRTSQEVLYETHRIALAYLEEGGAYSAHGIEELKKLDGYFIEKNISHGGCADLLAITIFLVLVMQY